MTEKIIVDYGSEDHRELMKVHMGQMFNWLNYGEYCDDLMEFGEKYSVRIGDRVIPITDKRIYNVGVM